MNIDLIVSLGVLASIALILHLKSHVKFIALGAYVGLVLGSTVAEPLFEYLAPRYNFFDRPGAVNSIQLILLLLPTIILGFNHSVDKRQLGLIKSIVLSIVITFFLLSNVLAFLPSDWVQIIQDKSLIAFQLLNLRLWLMVITAALIVIDSFSYKKIAGLGKKSK